MECINYFTNHGHTIIVKVPFENILYIETLYYIIYIYIIGLILTFIFLDQCMSLFNFINTRNSAKLSAIRFSKHFIIYDL